MAILSHHVLADIGIADGTTGKLHGLLKVSTGDARHFIHIVLHEIWVLCRALFFLNVALDRLTDGILAGALADLGNVGTREAIGVLRAGKLSQSAVGTSARDDKSQRDIL